MKPRNRIPELEVVARTFDREAWPTGGAATGPHGYYRNPVTSVSSPAQSVRHQYPDRGFSGTV